jgi:hypothetical protein
VTIYRVEPDGVGTTTLWRYRSEDDRHPVAVGILPPDPLGNQSEAWRDATTVFRAAAAVLAPSGAAVEAATRAAYPRYDVVDADAQYNLRAHVRYILAALRQHAEGSAS